jgi:hypothetical protein
MKTNSPSDKNKIFDIADIFELPDFGIVICGMSSTLSPFSKKDIVELIGKKIQINFENRNPKAFEVLKVEISTSITGQRNICINLGNKIKKSELLDSISVYQMK